MIDYNEVLKYSAPAVILVTPLLIPKIWDWWRESSKTKDENRRIVKKSLFQLLRLFHVLNECEYFLTCKGFKADYGLNLFVGAIPDQKGADFVMAHIMRHYEAVVDIIKKDIETTCNELSTVEPFIALRLSLLRLEQSNMGEMKKIFHLPFLPENALFEIVRFRKEMETCCIDLSIFLGRDTKKSTIRIIEAYKKGIAEAIDSFNKKKNAEESPSTP